MHCDWATACTMGIWSSSPGIGRGLSLSHAGSGARTAFCPMDTGRCFFGGGREMLRGAKLTTDLVRGEDVVEPYTTPRDLFMM